jgi:hypothetical protein
MRLDCGALFHRMFCCRLFGRSVRLPVCTHIRVLAGRGDAWPVAYFRLVAFHATGNVIRVFLSAYGLVLLLG